MELSAKLVTTLLFALNLGHLVFGIKCWECRSDVDPACADPFDNSTLAMSNCDYVDLDHLPGVSSTMCRKIRQKVKGEWRFYRSCGFLRELNAVVDDCLSQSGSAEIYMETCTCTSDGCNSSNLIFPTKFLLFILTLLCVAFVKIKL